MSCRWTSSIVANQQPLLRHCLQHAVPEAVVSYAYIICIWTGASILWPDNQSDCSLHITVNTAVNNMPPSTTLSENVYEIFGIDSLYTHQKLVISDIWKGSVVFLSTRTSSGKSMCYQAISTIFQHRNTEAIVLVISQLISIMVLIDQIMTT